MKFKAIAIGNTLMEDDGVGIDVLEKIRYKLEEHNIEAIIGETDAYYSISMIKDNDFVFIIDASYNERLPGQVTITDLKDYKCHKKHYTQHSYNLVDLIKLYFKQISGFVIEIEVASVDFKLGLSDKLQSEIDDISKDVLENILVRLKDVEGGR